MKRTNAEDFREAFLAEWQDRLSAEKEKLLAAYPSDSAWTKYMLDKEVGFLQGVRGRLPEGVNLSYAREWYTLDAVFYGGTDLAPALGRYPSELHVLIEHENGKDVETEMWKLIFWRSPLKVIIFYDYHDDQKTTEKERRWLEDKLAVLWCMLDSANSFLKENDETEYLFLIGTRKEAGGMPYWRWTIDSKRTPSRLGICG